MSETLSNRRNQESGNREREKRWKMKADRDRSLGVDWHCHFCLHFSLSDLHGRFISLTSKRLIFNSERLLILSNRSRCKNNIWNTIILGMFSSHLQGYKITLWMSFWLASSILTECDFYIWSKKIIEEFQKLHKIYVYITEKTIDTLLLY